MKHMVFLLAAGISLLHGFTQPAIKADNILSQNRVNEIFTETVKRQFKISYPIFRAYHYSDNSGNYYCVLTESLDSIANQKDSFNRNIRAITFKEVKGGLSPVWELNDHINSKDNNEYSIWFWTKYTSFADVDKDSLADPVIVYGTSGLDGMGDGRIKILIYYKKKKLAIRHQNGTLDFERRTQVDKAFYSLPQSLQSLIKAKMEEMVKQEHAIFPHGWQAAMKNKKLVIREPG